jgi:hypothetical protein
MRTLFIIGAFLLFTIGINAQRNLENLGRGLVAIRASANEVFVSWRVLGYEFHDTVTFNLYRNETLIASGLNVSNYVDNVSINGTYQVSAVINDSEQNLSDPCNVTTYKYEDNSLASIRIPIISISDYYTQCLWVGDLDGDGEYDFVLARKNSSSGTPLFLEAYSRQGVFLWKLDCGPNSYNKDNISPGSSTICIGHGDNVTVHDINNDGFAEVIIRTANGVRFGDGKILEEENNARQFISVLEGTTGTEIARAEVPTDFISDGPLNGHMGIAYLDGINPSVVLSAKNRRSDGGFNMLVSTWNWQNDSLIFNWKFIRNQAIETHYPDGHNIRIIDVDGDGRDEITPFGYTLDDDGLVLYTLADHNIVHGDRFFIGDMDPSHNGLEGYGIQQNNPNGLIWYYYDAKTGDILQQQFEDPIVSGDYGRGFVGDLDPRYAYYEFFTFTDGLYNVDGTRITTSKPDSYPNLRIWWDGDLLSENLDNKKMTKWDYIADIDDYEIRLYTFKDVIQDARNTPAFYGDILGDWREEAVYISDDEKNILIFTTVTPTSTKLYTLPHNPGYRNCLNLRGYYQGHMLDYYLGYDMDAPPAPNINIIGKNKKRTLPNGNFNIESAYSKMLLDTVNGISQQEANDKIGQVWRLIKNETHYEIYSMGANRYLSYLTDTVGSVLYLADSTNKSLFNIVECSNTLFNISPISDSNIVVNVYDTSFIDGNLIFAGKSDTAIERFRFLLAGNYFDCNLDWKSNAEYDNCGICTGGNTGYFPCSSVSTGIYKIKNSSSQLYLTQHNGNLVFEESENNDSQAWLILDTGHNSHLMLNKESNQYLSFEVPEIGQAVILDEGGKNIRMELWEEAYFLKPENIPELCFQVENVNENTGLVLNPSSLSDSNTFILESYIPSNVQHRKNKDFMYFPNPVNDKLFIILSDGLYCHCSVTIMNYLGHELKSQMFSSKEFTINLSELNSGIYLLKIQTDQFTRTIKVLKR